MKTNISILFILLFGCICGMAQPENQPPKKHIEYYHAIDVGAGFGILLYKNNNSCTRGVSVRETHGILIRQHLVVGLNLEFKYDNISFRKYQHEPGFHALGFSTGLNLRYLVLKKFKWSPLLMFNWNVGMYTQGKKDQNPVRWEEVRGVYYNISFFSGCNYRFKDGKSVYALLGCDISYPGPAMRIGIRF
jgi:hypothetical protein